MANPQIVGVGVQQSFPDFSINLSSGEQSTLAINFDGYQHSYEWVLLVDYLIGTREYSRKITAPGNKPFLLTGPAKKYRVRYVSNGSVGGAYHLAR